MKLKNEKGLCEVARLDSVISVMDIDKSLCYLADSVEESEFNKKVIERFEIYVPLKSEELIKKVKGDSQHIIIAYSPDGLYLESVPAVRTFAGKLYVDIRRLYYEQLS